MDSTPTEQVAATAQDESSDRPLPIVRSAVGGFLMGLANLVPGISGGTMILVLGLYDEFIKSLADVTRFRFSRRSVGFLGLVACTAGLAIVFLAGTLSRAVSLHETAMYSLFLGMTLAGVPLLMGMIGKTTASSLTGMIVGLTLMVAIAFTKNEPPDKDAIRATLVAGAFAIEPAYARDLAAGVLGMSAMVLPGISGAYMLLILDRYETILAAIDAAKHYVLSRGVRGEPAEFLRVIIPVAIGSIFSLVALSNLLKWMLRRYEKATLGLLLGVVLGSVAGIWPFHQGSSTGDYALGIFLASLGFVATFLLSRVRA